MADRAVKIFGVETISPDTDIYTLAIYFRDKPVRRFPVVDSDGELVG